MANTTNSLPVDI